VSHWGRFSFVSKSILLITADKNLTSDHGLEICAHDRGASIYSDTLIGTVLRCRQLCWELEASLDLNQCEYCFTEFCLDFMMIGGPKAIFFSRWKDLEEGSSMLDSKCQRHLLPRNKVHHTPAESKITVARRTLFHSPRWLQMRILILPV
jgi:hypothetical protein